MTQIEQIKAEIKRLRNECAKSIGDGFVDGDLPKTMTSGGGAWVCEQLLSFIESMEKEYLPSNLDEAAKQFQRRWDNDQSPEASFKAGAEWMAGQGVRAHCFESANPVSESPDVKSHLITLLYDENEHTPYVCSGDDIDIIIRKK